MMQREGDFVDSQGNVLGRHRGIAYYTIGQRRGIGIPAENPYYVLKINPTNQQITLGLESELYSRGCVAGEVNWVSVSGIDKETVVRVKIRYATPAVESRLIPLGNGVYKVLFCKEQRAVTPGQSVVCYDDDILLCGGIIQEVIE